MNRDRTSRFVLSLGLVVLLAACRGAGGSSQPPDDGAIDHPTGANEVVLRVSTGGGFVMPEFLFSAVPQFTLYGDGRVLVPGAVPAIYPGPAIMPIQERRLNEEGIQAVLAAVAETGLFVTDARFDGAQAMVADAGDTTFELHADGTSVTISVYALGFLDPANLPPQISQAEVAAHGSLMDLSTFLTTLDTQLDATAWADETWETYQPQALRLSVRQSDADALDGTETFAEWPIEGEDPAAFGDTGTLPGTRCGGVTGAAATTWLEALATANQSTRFTADDHRYAVTVRPVLPDETADCPAVG
jgi:hypothetical protein